jgi:hypothetical protein
MSNDKSKLVDGWFNIYLIKGEIVIGSTIGFKTEEEAKSMRICNCYYIKTIKISNETKKVTNEQRNKTNGS